jgi:uncharacterized damage-inducible protein DinB
MKSSIISRNQRYGAQVQSLLDSLGAYSNEQLNRKPADGGWSPMQVLYHLALSEELSMAYVRKKMGFTSEFEENNVKARLRSFVLWFSLKMPFRYAAPRAIGKEFLPENSTLEETRAKWEEARRVWDSFFEQLPTELANKLVYKHPRAGRVTWLQMLGFFETHLARHKKQIFKNL